MTILFVGTEDLAFTLIGNAFPGTGTGNFDAAYSRAGIRLDLSSDAMRCVFDSNASSIYVTYRFFHESIASSQNDSPHLTIYDGTIAVFKIHPSNGAWNVYTYDGGGQQLRDTISPRPPSGAFRWTVQFNLNTSGGFTVWVGNTVVASFSGDTITGTGATTCSEAQWSGAKNPTQGVEQTVSECVVATTHTINMRVATLVPEADGTNNDWANGFAAVDEITANTVDNISSNAADEVETMNLGNYAGSTDLVVKALSVAAQAVRGSTGPQNLQLAVRENVTDGFSASNLLTEVYTDYRARFDNNPDTGSPWTLAELDTMQAGVKSIA